MRVLSVSFRVMHSDLDPGSISAVFGVTPTEAHRRSDPIIIRSTGKTTGSFTEGQWTLESDLSETADVEAHVRRLLDRLQVGIEALHVSAPSGYRMDLMVGIFIENGNAGFRISADSLERLANLGVDLELDLYSA